MDELTQWLAALGLPLPGPSVTWDEPLLLLHLSADGLAMLAALAIPLGVLLLLRRRPDLDYRALWILLALVALGGGLLHLASAWELWAPQPWRLGSAKAVAALAGLLAAAALWGTLPRAHQAPSSAGLRDANLRLNRELREQQQTLQVLESREALLDGAFDQAELGLALVSPAGRWVALNPSLAELLGRGRAELLRQPPSRILPEAVLKPGATLEQEWGLTDGRSRWLHFSSQALPGAGAKPAALLVQCQDLSKQHQAEQTQARTRRELEAQLAELVRTQGDTAARLEQELAERMQLETEARHYADQLEASSQRLETIEGHLSRMVRIDPETGLLSRHHFLIELVRAVAAARRYGMSLGLLLVTPEAGERPPGEAVAVVAGVLREVVRETDAAGRYDERGFAVVLPQADRGATRVVAEKLRLAVAAQQQECVDGVSCSVGMALWQRGQGAAELLRQAALALRRARGAGEAGTPAEAD